MTWFAMDDATEDISANSKLLGVTMDTLHFSLAEDKTHLPSSSHTTLSEFAVAEAASVPSMI